MTKKYDLECRLCEIMAKQQKPISFAQIETSLNKQYNKSSIYRQLNKLITAHKISRMETSQGSFYEEFTGNNNHLHTYCQNCSEIECHKEKVVYQNSFKDDFLPKSNSFVVEGVCKKCQ